MNSSLNEMIGPPLISINDVEVSGPRRTRINIIAPGAEAENNTLTESIDVTLPEVVAADAIQIKSLARLATAAALPAHTFTPGTNTLTASSNVALSVDGVAVAVNDRVLVWSEAASHLQHGLYKVIATGSGAAPWILERVTDWDDSTEFEFGTGIVVSEGVTQAGWTFRMTTTGAIVLNTTAIAFEVYSKGVIAGQQDIALTKSGRSELLRDARVENINNLGSDVTAFDAAVTAATAAGRQLEATDNVAITASRAIDRALIRRKSGLYTISPGAFLQIRRGLTNDDPRTPMFAFGATVNQFAQVSAFDSATWIKTSGSITATNVRGTFDRFTASGAGGTVSQVPVTNGGSALVNGGTRRVSIDAAHDSNGDYLTIRTSAGDLSRFDINNGLVAIRDAQHAAWIEPKGWVRMTGTATLTFADLGATGTITRSTGDFTADGFVVGMRIRTRYAVNAVNNITDQLVTTVTATVLTVAYASFTAEAGTSGVEVDGPTYYTCNVEATSWTTGTAVEFGVVNNGESVLISGAYTDQRAEVRLRATTANDNQTVLWANDFPGADIGAQWNNMMRGYQHIQTTALSPPALGIRDGDYVVNTTLDMTALRSSTTIITKGVRFKGDVGPRKAVIDATGSTNLNFPFPLIITGQVGANAPNGGCAVGVLVSRPRTELSKLGSASVALADQGDSSGKHQWDNVRISGFFSFAPWLNISAEEDRIKGGSIDQSVWVSQNLAADISSSDTTIQVTDGTAFHDPSLATGIGPYFVMLSRVHVIIGGSYSDYEIVRVHEKSGNNLTVFRGCLGTTAVAWTTADSTKVAENALHTFIATSGKPLPNYMLDWVKGRGSISPHSDPGNSIAQASSSGLYITDTQVLGATMLGTIYVDGFSKFSAPNCYVTGGPAPFVKIDVTRNSIGGVDMPSIYCHGSTLSNAQSAIEVVGAGQGAEASGLNFRMARTINCGVEAFKIGQCTVTKSNFEWSDQFGLTCHASARLIDVGIVADAFTNPPIVLPTSDSATSLLRGRYSGRIRVRDINQITRAFDMQGAIIECTGFVERSTGVVTAAAELQIIGRENVTARFVDGFQVQGKRGANLIDANQTVIVPTGTWYLLAGGTLTGPRVLTLGTTGAVAGDVITIARQDITNNAFTVENHDGTDLLIFPAGETNRVRFRYDGVDWSVLEINRPEVDAPLIQPIPLPTMWSYYWDADMLQQANGTSVPVLYNMVGSDHFLFETNAGTYQSRAFGGRAALRMQAAGAQCYTCNALTTLQETEDSPLTCVVQYQHVTTAGAQTFFCFGNSASATQRMRMFGSAGIAAQKRGDAGSTFTTTPVVPQDATTPHILALRHSGTSMSVYQDDMATGVIESFGSNAADGTFDRFCIGGSHLGSATPSNLYDGYIRRIAFAATELTEANLQTVEDAWSGK